MKLILFFLMTTDWLFSSNLSNLYKLYEKQSYNKACDYGYKYLFKNHNISNEKYLTLYGLSCLETDNIKRISLPMVHLTSTKDARANASYFGTILLQKQLLLQALVDKKEIYDLHLPKTNFVLSKIFYLFMQKKYRLKNEVYRFQDETKESMSYQLYIKRDKKDRVSMIIDVYQNDKFTKRYNYR